MDFFYGRCSNQRGFENLRSGTEYDACMKQPCVERADWIVSINATRLFSTLYGQTLNVGRVMTPTLAMVVMREAAISAFKTGHFTQYRLNWMDLLHPVTDIRNCLKQRQ